MAKGSSPHLFFLGGTFLLLTLALTLLVKEGQGLRCHTGGNYNRDDNKDCDEDLQEHEVHESCQNRGKGDRDLCMKYQVRSNWVERKCACSKGLSEKYVLDECRVTKYGGDYTGTTSCICNKDLCNNGDVKLDQPEISCYVGYGFVDNSFIREEKKNCSEKNLKDHELHKSCKKDRHSFQEPGRRDHCVTVTFGEDIRMFGKQCGCSDKLPYSIISDNNNSCFEGKGGAVTCGCDQDFCNDMYGSTNETRKVGGASTLSVPTFALSLSILILIRSLYLLW